MPPFSDDSFLPMFPLGMVAYPTLPLNLHIFEPRYRQLIEDCDQRGYTFGIPTVVNNQLKNLGTEMQLVSIEKIYEDGRMDVKTLGLRSFEILSFENQKDPKLYGAAKVKYFELDSTGDLEMYETLIEQVTLLFALFNIQKTLPTLQSGLTTFKLASHSGLNLEQELHFLSIQSEVERQLFLINHLNEFIPRAQEMEEMRKKIQLNGHFRNVIPPDIA